MSAARWARALACAVVAAVLVPVAAGAADPAAADPATTSAGLSVDGPQLLLDGQPFLPRGFNLIGLLAPDWCTATASRTASAAFGQAELDAAKQWHATTLRFQVSQRGLADPAVAPEARAAYLQKVRDGVSLARTNGFVVVLSMQDQSLGCGATHPMPSDQTVAAWNALAPAFAGDPYVAFELFNEPRNDTSAAGWAQWHDGGSSPDANLGDPAVGFQTLVDSVRALGAPNVLIADGARLAERTAGLPLLTDPAGKVVYGIHPYAFTGGPSWWDQQYGSLAAVAPVLATEWNYLAKGCGGAAEQLAPALLGYLRDHGIGVLGHAFDVPKTIVADGTWAPTACGTPAGGSGAVLQSFFAGLADAQSPPTAPAGLRVTALAPQQVDLAWDPASDDVGVTGYRVVRDGTVVAETAATTWSDTGVTPGSDHVYTVRAVDGGGGVGPDAQPLPVSTPVQPPDTVPPSTPTPLTVRVNGPAQVLLGWPAAGDDVGVTGYRVSRDGQLLTTVTGLTATDAAPGPGAHLYSVVAVDAAGNVSPPSTAAATVPAAAPSGLTGTYFDTATLTTQKLVRTDRTVNFGWGTASPAKGIGADTFSVRWTGRVLPTADGAWTFYTRSDEGVRLWIDGVLVIDNWTAHLLTEKSATVTLGANQAHDLRIEYYDRTGTAAMRLLWSGPGTAEQVIPAARLLAA